MFVTEKHSYILGWKYEFSAVFFSYGGVFHQEGSFHGVNMSEEIMLLFEIILCFLLSLFRLNFTRGVVQGNCPG